MLEYSKYLAKTSSFPVDLRIDRAQGSYLFDESGKRYLDLISGIAVSHLGYNHPYITGKIKDQLDQHTHIMVYGEYPQKVQDKFAEKIITLLGGPFEQIFLTNSGTEANEGALKMAKRYTGRSELIAFKNSYHGSTHGSLSVSGNESRKRAFRPLLPDVRFLEFNNIDSLDKISESSAAVIIEPVQGDAGVRIASKEFLLALRDKCDKTGTLLIFDEVQSGFGRTGKWFAFQHYPVKPDIITLGKAMGAGLPVGGFAASENIMSCLMHDPPLGHITTYGGNPVCCASGMAAIELMENEMILEQVESKGQLFEELLKHKEIQEIRRIGLMMAVDLSNEQKVNSTVEAARKSGSLIYWFLSTKHSFRLAPPLNITEEDIRKGCTDILFALG